MGFRLFLENARTLGVIAVGSGGGIYNGQFLNVSNSTISGNLASGNGGGIYNDGTLTLVFSTLTLNSAVNGGGVYNEPGGRLRIVPGVASARNTIIASNLLNADGINPDVSGTFTSNGYNLIGSNTGSTGFGITGDIVVARTTTCSGPQY